MIDPERNHWFKDHKGYWISFLLLIIAQAWITSRQTPWPPFAAWLIFFGAYLVINVLVSVIILVLTWPARRNFHFSRYIKILIAFAAVFFLSQLIAVLVAYFQG
jgi:hypothetical protein